MDNHLIMKPSSPSLETNISRTEPSIENKGLPISNYSFSAVKYTYTILSKIEHRMIFKRILKITDLCT